MQLKLQTDYALRTLMYLGNFGGLVRLDDVAGAYAVSREHLVKIVQRLAREGWVATRPGRGGGMRLAVDPADIDVADVVSAFEGRDGPLACVADPDVCILEPGCRLRRRLIEAENAFYATLAGTTLADLVRRPGRDRGVARLPAPGSRAP